MDTEQMTENRAPNPAEIALIVKMFREHAGWSQETLAEISGLTPRTIQRVEGGESTSIDTHRALARAFGFENIDAFDERMDVPSPEEGKALMDKATRDNVILDVVVMKSGKQLVEFAESIDAFSSNILEVVPREAAEIAAETFDFLTEYVDCHDLYTHVGKLDVHDQMTEKLNELGARGISMCAAVRPVKFSGTNWENKTPMPMTIGYVLVCPTTGAPTKVMVPKELRFG